MRLLSACVTCLLAGSLVSLSAAAELPPEWWLTSDEDPFFALQQELGDLIPDALKGGPVAASAAASGSGVASSAFSSGSGAFAQAGARRPSPPSRLPARPPMRQETVAMAGFVDGPGAEGDAKRPAAAARPAARPTRRPLRPTTRTTTRPTRLPTRRPTPRPARRPTSRPADRPRPRPATRQPGGGPIIFPDTPLPGSVQVFNENEVRGGQCTCVHRSSCTGQPAAPRGQCAAGQVCCPPQHQYRSKCGQMMIQPRITENPVHRSTVPWMAALMEKVQNGFIFVCGGSLIHQQVVLTAARCVDRFQANKKALTVRLGDTDILSTDEVLEPVEMKVKDIIIHANYSRDQKYNDLALLFLEEPAPLRPGLDTICIRREVTSQYDCGIHSYGLRELGSTEFDLRLREANQELLPFSDCQRLLRNSPRGPFFSLHPSFQCTRSNATCDLSEDRAGSPLTCPDDLRAEHQLRGVVAWGVGCGSQQKPGVYTSVPDMYPWIDGQVTRYFGYIESAFGPLNQV